MHLQNLDKFYPKCSQIFSRNEILLSIKGHSFVTIVRKMMCNNPKLDLVNMNAYIKFGENLLIYSQDIEQKRNSGVNQWAITLIQMSEK